MTPAMIETLFSRLEKSNPQPKTELCYHSDFELLIAVILSARATDKSVNKATEKLFIDANTPEKILALGLPGLENAVKTIGLYKTKAKNIMNTCDILVHRFHSHVPHTREDLESLPGVGRKTANVLLNTLFGEPVIAVDTHIFRVANRIGLADGNTVVEVEKQLEKVIPKKFLLNAHHWLVLHGRYVCIARKPKCEECILSDLCEYYRLSKK